MGLKINSLIGRLLICIGLALTVIISSGCFPLEQIKDIQALSSAIFNTNCTLALNQPQTCQRIHIIISALLIVSAALILIFYKSYSFIFTALSLCMFAFFYCNPNIDISFNNFIHFTQICAICSGLLFLAFKKITKTL